ASARSRDGAKHRCRWRWGWRKDSQLTTRRSYEFGGLVADEAAEQAFYLRQMRGVLLLALLMTSCAAPAAAPVTAGPATRSVLTVDPSRASAATPTPAATAS